jgi:dTDP-4-dehydrorhamnose reductase
VKIEPGTRIYIAGCGGMLGEAVYRTLSARCDVRATDIDINEPWLAYADIRDHAAVLADIQTYAPDAIVNLAALTDLEQCEREPDNAWATNAYAAEVLGRAAADRDIPYVFISTAGIFDGLKDVYTEDDEPVPLSVYGKTKHYAEKAIQTSVPRHLVLRAGWMMGAGPRKDKKFINKIYRQIAAGATELRVVDDKLGTPTYTYDFARGILRLLEGDLVGLYNQVGGGQGSRYHVAREFVRLLGLEDRVRVVHVSSDEFAAEYFAPRPHSECLVNQRLDRLGLNTMRDWRVCLEEYAQQFARDLASRTMPVAPHA